MENLVPILHEDEDPSIYIFPVGYKDMEDAFKLCKFERIITVNNLNYKLLYYEEKDEWNEYNRSVSILNV